MQSVTHPLSRRSIARRTALFGGAFLAVVLAAICGVMTTMLLAQAQERTLSWVDARVDAVVRSMDAYDHTAGLMVERFFNVYGDQFGKHFTLDEAGGRLMQLGIALNGYHNHADKFSEITGGAAAVLVRQGDGFVAINASLKNDKGERAVGLTVGAGHPAVARLQRGEPYVGRATLYGRDYITRLQPVRDLQGKVVGALLVAFDLSRFDEALDALVDQTRFFDSGGAFVVAPGTGSTAAILHPAARRAPAPAALLEALRNAVPSQEVSGYRPVLAPKADDRFAVARRSEATGLWVVAEVSKAEAARAQWRMLLPFLALFGAAVAGLCAGLFVLLRRWVGQPLQSLTGALERVASGDLSQAVASDRSDEIGEMMRGVERLRQRFVEMLGAVRAAADAIAIASSEIAGGNEDLSRRTEETAARLQQTASAMEQVCGTVRASAEAAGAADGLAGTASQAAERGGEAVAQVVEKMNSISACSERIAEITSVIDAIAFQTNILALNAAVEAARAGDSGRGFAVVATEVRALAQRVASAAREIKTLVGSSAEEVRSGTRLADAASARMQEILTSVRRVNGTLAVISAGAAEQSDGLGQVTDSVSSLDRMTQQNAALVEESAAAAASLQAQAQRLVEAMAIFRLESATAGG